MSNESSQRDGFKLSGKPLTPSWIGALMLIVFIILLIPALALSFQNITKVTTITNLIVDPICNYSISNQNSVYQAQNGFTGITDYTGTNATTLINTVINVVGQHSNICFAPNNFSVSTILVSGKTFLSLTGSPIGQTVLTATRTNLPIIKIGERQGGSGTASTNIRIENFYMDGTAGTTQAVDPFATEGAEGIEIAGPAQSCLDTTDITIRNNQIFNTGSDSIFGNYAGRVYVSNNLIQSTRGYWASIHSHGCHTMYVTTNSITSSSVGGIRHGAQIIGNFMRGCGAIDVNGQSRPCIMGGGTDGSVVASMNGEIENNYAESASASCINLWDDKEIVIGNTCKGGGAGAGPLATFPGINISQARFTAARPLSNVVVSSNTVFNFQISYWVRNVTDSIITENEAYGCSASIVRCSQSQSFTILTSVNGTQFTNNIPFNPVGKITNMFAAILGGGNSIGLLGTTTTVTASTDYVATGVNLYVTSTGGTSVAIIIKDPAGNTVWSPGATISGYYLSIGYKINFGACSPCPTVTVFGA